MAVMDGGHVFSEELGRRNAYPYLSLGQGQRPYCTRKRGKVKDHVFGLVEQGQRPYASAGGARRSAAGATIRRQRSESRWR